MTYLETVWEFNTKRFRVALEIGEETTDPADSFQFQEDIDAVYNGDVAWFWCRVAVYLKADKHTKIELGADSLGCCAYSSVQEFYTSHRDPDPMNRNCTIMRAARGRNAYICYYFPGMVSQAIGAARRRLTNMPAMRAV
jgi:hypothetical protein